MITLRGQKLMIRHILQDGRTVKSICGYVAVNEKVKNILQRRGVRPDEQGRTRKTA